MTTHIAFAIIVHILILAAFTGWATFRVMYKPWRMKGHSRVGQHLIRTADSLLALMGVSLLGAILPIPDPVMGALTILVLAWLAIVAWERVALLRWERKHRTPNQ